MAAAVFLRSIWHGFSVFSAIARNTHFLQLGEGSLRAGRLAAKSASWCP